MSEFEKAKKRYNEIMIATCYEYLTIGSEFSEETDHYGYEEMVKECDYLLSTYYEEGHSNEELRRDDNKVWRSHTGKLKRFIAKYKEYYNPTDKQRGELQNKMWDKLEAVIENLREKNKINLVQYTIARDVLYDCTELHTDITKGNNIAQEFINNQKEFIDNLRRGYEEMKKDFPEIDNWSAEEINEHSHEYKDCVY